MLRIFRIPERSGITGYSISHCKTFPPCLYRTHFFLPQKEQLARYLLVTSHEVRLKPFRLKAEGVGRAWMPYFGENKWFLHQPWLQNALYPNSLQPPAYPCPLPISRKYRSKWFVTHCVYYKRYLYTFCLLTLQLTVFTAIKYLWVKGRPIHLSSYKYCNSLKFCFLDNCYNFSWEMRAKLWCQFWKQAGIRKRWTICLFRCQRWYRHPSSW